MMVDKVEYSPPIKKRGMVWYGMVWYGMGEKSYQDIYIW